MNEGYPVPPAFPAPTRAEDTAQGRDARNGGRCHALCARRGGYNGQCHGRSRHEGCAAEGVIHDAPPLSLASARLILPRASRNWSCAATMHSSSESDNRPPQLPHDSCLSEELRLSQSSVNSPFGLFSAGFASSSSFLTHWSQVRVLPGVQKQAKY